jgi:hypothetical protein
VIIHSYPIMNCQLSLVHLIVFKVRRGSSECHSVDDEVSSLFHVNCETAQQIWSKSMGILEVTVMLAIFEHSILPFIQN